MRATPFFVAAAAVLLPACANDGSGPKDTTVVPEGLTVKALAGGNGVLEVVALTLKAGRSGMEVYASLKNKGSIPACGAALSVELYDKHEQSVAAGIGALFTRHFYRLKDGSGTIAGCIGPGDVTMAAVTDLLSDVAVKDVGYVVYRCPYYALDVAPIKGLKVGPVTSVAQGGKTTYKGTLVNELDVPVSNPSVTVFPVNGAGRPLGVTSGKGTSAIPPGGSWAFETSSMDETAADYAAYPAGSFAK